MAITLVMSISFLFLLTFSVTRRKIHLFEGIVIWCLLLHVQNNENGFLGVDFKLLTVSRNFKLYLNYNLIRCVIVPLIVILFLEAHMTVRGIWRKSMCWAAVILLLVGIEYLADWLDILEHSEKWKVWWSFAMWAATIVLTIAAHQWFRRVASRDVIL